MQKLRLFLSFILVLFLASCAEQTVSVTFTSIEYDEIVIEGMEGKSGEEIQLVAVEQDWYSFEGWYTDQEYTTLVESIVLEDDITIYGKFTPSLSIAILGNPTDIQYDEILKGIDEYSNLNNRVYRVYDTSKTDPYKPTVTLEAIDDAVSDGANLIVLTSGFYHSQATYVAQTKYPDVNFVLIGGEPKENAFYSEPVTTSNTLTTTYPDSLGGFLAGYFAVYEGYYNLGVLNRNIDMGVGFIAGAYYAAKELEVDITINKKAYINLDRPSMLVQSLYADTVFDLDVDLIYTFALDEHTILEDSLKDTDLKMVLAPKSYTNQSSSILYKLDLNRSDTIKSILNNYFDKTFTGGKSIQEDVKIGFSNDTNFDNAEFNRIRSLINDGTINIPSDYDSLCIFFETIGTEKPKHIDEYLVEGYHTVEDLIR